MRACRDGKSFIYVHSQAILIIPNSVVSEKKEPVKRTDFS